MANLEALINKYNKSGPRYTSYPPVPFWKGAPSDEVWFDHVKKYSKEGIDLYIHVPFCEKLCWYCGCNRTITKDHDVENAYVNLIKSEWDIYRAHLGKVKINSLHFGGGTPTFLSAKNLAHIINYLRDAQVDNFIGSIEVDPRTCTREHLLMLKEKGFSRLSLGIQDFDPTVQQAINRYQPVELVRALVDEIRAIGLESINFDLIYGLPRQTLESVKNTIEIVKELSPDLIAFYGYAHLPHKISNQKLIKNEDLPHATLRQELYQIGKKLLREAGLIDIGMDHFAKESSYLYLAKKNNRLHRNFMGYTDQKSSVLIGLGPSAISDSSVSFRQNPKELNAYKRLIDEGRLVTENGHIQNEQDLKTQKQILSLMCENRTTIDKSLPYYDEIIKELDEFQSDGLLERSAQEVTLTETGKIFMRNIAMSFDFHLRTQQEVKFSQTI